MRSNDTELTNSAIARRLAELGVLPRQIQKHFDGLKKLGRVPITDSQMLTWMCPPNVRYWG